MSIFKRIALVALFALLPMQAMAQAVTSTPIAPIPVPHVTNIATRQLMDNSNTAQTAVMSRAMFWSRESGSNPIVQVTACRIAGTGGGETCVANTTWKVAIYDFTSLATVQCGSVTTSTVATIPCVGMTLVKGHQYAACSYVTNGTSVNYYQTLSVNGLTTFDGVEFGGSDKTASCASVVDGSGQHNQFNPPVGIFLPTTSPSPCYIGDSRAAGYNAAWDVDADLGDLAPSIGKRYGYIQAAVGGATAAAYIASHANRDIILKAGCTMIIDEFGVNDMVVNAVTPANVAVSHTTIAGYYTPSNIAVYGTTIMTETSGTDNAATNAYSTVNNQVCTGTGCTQPPAFNLLMRAGISGENGYFDVVKYFDPGLTGYWCIGPIANQSIGTANYCVLTDAGPAFVHAATQGEIGLENSGLINLAVFQ